ncbi:SseB protein N-terminal domain-containing protein [Micromonospora phaseoli]|uniref:SseB protein N-terminal domain-containing protein n=1 Tax=Micromonospora phaseoli TaxID=1144548 RepID=A0A1H7ALZ0_9ACTN|nr:SseB family protein [Micromonospora phaseoli]PZV96287.1 type III secretion system (T3SS) SseB-like protein [Micromonospora phaseoli]SEJ66681.1 SseB protein N-terminal domain-containing protein [Micromonospora phaseoli]
MTEWEPATEAEAALRDALLGNDQQLYFRILSSVELLLPVSAQAAAGQAPVGWGTWTTGGRTHVLAFTSAEAMRVCLGEHAGPSRRTGYAELATAWPDHEWWLAVNPGLPIEGYLPAWYVSQLSRGDVRLPGRTLGARARLERVEALNRSREATPGTPVPPAPAAANGTPKQRPPGIRPSRPTAPSPVPSVPATIHLPEVPVVAPAPARGAARQEPAGWAPARPGQATPDSSPSAGGGRPGAVGGDRRGGFGGGPEGPGAAPLRRPMPFRSEDPGLSGRGRPTTSERPGSPTNGRPAETGAEQSPPRSFFEPAAGRPSHRGDRLADRAAPPSRFRGGQPFPRRGAAGDPSSEGNSRAFVFAEDDQSANRISTEASEEATQPLPPPGPADQETTRPLRVTTPAGWAAPAGGDPTAGGGEANQGLPRRRPTDGTDEEELPVSVAEPVSGPPATRRGFTPIVIEGTIIEARDLIPTNGVPAMPAPRPHRPTGDDAPEVTARIPTAGSEPTVPGPTLGSEPTVPIASAPPEPTVPIVTAPPEPTVPIVTAPPEPTVPVHTVIAEPEVGAEPGYASAAPAAAPVHASPAAPSPAAASSAAPAPAAPAPAAPSPAAPVPAAPPAIVPSAIAAPATGAVPPAGGAPSAAPDPAAPATADPPFQPANEVEEDLLGAAGAGSTDTFLSTLLLARVLMPVAADSAPGSRPGDPGFVWPAVELDGQTFVVAYTSPQRLADHTDPTAETVQVRFVQLIRRWPDTSWSFAVNPGTPVGAKLPGEQIIGLATWAAELGLGDDSEGEPEPAGTASAPASGPRSAAPPADPARPIVMQKAIAPSQLGYYLERGYDRVSGFVHRASELAHLTTPTALYQALGLSHPESPFAPDAEQIYVLRWPAYRPSLYRIPYGGQNEAAMRAMEGWVIERPPFRGNGFAPGESSDVLAEFKVDSVRLPHGAQLLRIDAEGAEVLVAVLDADTYSWQQVGER